MLKNNVNQNIKNLKVFNVSLKIQQDEMVKYLDITILFLFRDVRLIKTACSRRFNEVAHVSYG